MAGNFLVRPEKLIAKRSLIDADKTTASTTWVAVAGTKTKFSLGSDSLFQAKVAAVISAAGGAARVDLDIAVDGKLIGYDAAPAAVAAGANGSTNGLASVDIPAAAKLAVVGLDETLDTLGTGEHSFELFFKASANTAVIKAAVGSNPLKYTLVEHASAYPPHQQAAY